MSRYLIVNADDFGLCEDISRGIIKAHEEGIVTSTSVVVNGSYFEKGIDEIKRTGIDAGIHLTFVGSERPVSGYIDGLVDESGLFLKDYKRVMRQVLLGRFDKKALQKELYAQITILRDAGIKASHIDSHQHLHILPGVRDLVTDMAKQFGVKWVRAPHASSWDISGLGMNTLSSIFKKKMKEGRLCHTDNFEGFGEGGRLNEAALLAKIDNLKEGISELMVHPGYDASGKYDWGYDWEGELRALVSEAVKDRLKKAGILLKSFREME